MYTVYRMKANELDNRFLKSLKAMFKDKEIEIAVSETTALEEDETAYLLKSPANREHLITALENIANQKNLMTIELDELPLTFLTRRAGARRSKNNFSSL